MVWLMKLKTKYRFFAKISLLAVVLFFGAFNIKAVNAQTISPNPLSTSIAVVDIKLIVEKSKAALSLAKQLQETQGKFQKEIKKVETSLKEKEEKLVKQKTIIEEDWRWTHPTYVISFNKRLIDLVKAEIDPSKRMADVDRKNNLIELHW